MKYLRWIPVAACVGVGCVFAPGLMAGSAPRGADDQLSYTLGYSTGETLSEEQLQISSSKFNQGLQDALQHHQPVLSQQKMHQVLEQFRKQRLAQMQAQQAKVGASHMAAGEAFLEKNKTEPGVVTLPSGLQYKVVVEGKGPVPTLHDTVKVDYEGSLLNGEVFDSSYKRGEPATFPLRGLIKGWQEALTLMPTGSTWMLYVPSDLAYGARGAGPIGPNETLIFKIQLHEVVS